MTKCFTLKDAKSNSNKRYSWKPGIIGTKKTAFLCSRKISSKAVLRCYDWAIKQRENGNCVISDFHSKIEKDVFHYLAKGSQPIILVLPRGLKKRWEPEIKSLLELTGY